MSRLIALVMALMVLPATAVSAASLDELLERSRNASYSAEQTISCSTPEGLRDAVVTVAQNGGEIRVGSTVSEDLEISAGFGGWTLSRGGGVVSHAAVEGAEESVEPLYAVEDGGAAIYLGRAAFTYRLIRDSVMRAKLVFDDRTGAMMAVTTLSTDGSTYCERRFVSFDPNAPGFEPVTSDQVEELAPIALPDTDLPESIAGFIRLDLYEDEEGFTFAYYSDGFFSFAVFETPARVTVPEPSEVEFGSGIYQRSFTAGQATYVWETSDAVMALVGDLPPDLHEAVLSELPASDTPNLFRRWWRSLFG